MGGSFPWSCSSSPLFGFRFCGSRGGGPRGGAGGGGPLNGFCSGFGFGVVFPNWLCIGRDHANLWLVEGIILGVAVDCGGVGVAMVWILAHVWS